MQARWKESLAPASCQGNSKPINPLWTQIQQYFCLISRITPRKNSECFVKLKFLNKWNRLHPETIKMSPGGPNCWRILEMRMTYIKWCGRLLWIGRHRKPSASNFNVSSHFQFLQVTLSIASSDLFRYVQTSRWKEMCQHGCHLSWHITRGATCKLWIYIRV